MVKIKAVSINPVDVKVRRDPEMVTWLFGNKRPLVLGWDISGEVVKKGKLVSSFQCGDSVFGMVNFPGIGNAYAEYIAVPENHLYIKRYRSNIPQQSIRKTLAIHKKKPQSWIEASCGEGGIGLAAQPRTSP